MTGARGKESNCARWRKGRNAIAPADWRAHSREQLTPWTFPDTIAVRLRSAIPLCIRIARPPGGIHVAGEVLDAAHRDTTPRVDVRAQRRVGSRLIDSLRPNRWREEDGILGEILRADHVRRVHVDVHPLA